MDGDRLTNTRRRQFLSQRALARKAGVSRQTIFDLENGLRLAYPATLLKISSALGVKPSYLAPAALQTVA